MKMTLEATMSGGHGSGKKEAESIESLIRSFYHSASDDDKENIKAFEKHHTKKNQAKVNRMFDETFRSVTGAFEEQLSHEYQEGGDAKVDVKKDKDKFYRIGIKLIKGYFEKAQPSVLKTLGENPETKKYVGDPHHLSSEELKAAFKALATHYDREVGAGEIEGVVGLSNLETILEENFKGEDGVDSEVTRDMLGELFGRIIDTHKSAAPQKFNAHAASAYIAHLPAGVYASHLTKRLKQRGHTINGPEALKFHTQSPMTLASDIHIPLATRDYDKMKAAKHHFYIKEGKEGSGAHGGGH
jgi:hypothetical protein